MIPITEQNKPYMPELIAKSVSNAKEGLRHIAENLSELDFSKPETVETVAKCIRSSTDALEWALGWKDIEYILLREGLKSPDAAQPADQAPTVH